MSEYRHTFEDVKSDRALVCKKEINGEQGGATVFHVMVADGFLLDCGSGVEGEQRANILAIQINRGRPELFTRQGLATWTVGR